MKKTIYTVGLMAVALMAHSQSPAQNEVKAEQNVEAAKTNLKIAQQNLDAAYIPFRKDAEVQINANDQAIKDLRAKLIKRSKSPENNARRQKIDVLEKRNVDLRNRLYAYESERSDWATFKAKFTHDKDDLHDAVKDFDKDMEK
jgi:hypothetical protein